MGSELFSFHGLTSSRGEGMMDVATFKSAEDGTKTPRKSIVGRWNVKVYVLLVYVAKGRVK